MAANESNPDGTRQQTRLEYKRAWDAAHPEQLKAYAEKYRKSPKGMARDRKLSNERRRLQSATDGSRETRRLYASTHRAQINEGLRKWREAHPGYTAAASKKYRDANWEQVRECQKKCNEARREEKRAYNIQYRQEHLEEIKQQIQVHKRMVRDRPEARMLDLTRTARYRAKKKGLEFDGLPHLVGTMPLECACCGVLLDYARSQGRKLLGGPSLDRFDTKRGYTSDNVRVICLRCNQLKNNGTLEQMEAIVAYMRSKPGI